MRQVLFMLFVLMLALFVAMPARAGPAIGADQGAIALKTDMEIRGKAPPGSAIVEVRGWTANLLYVRNIDPTEAVVNPTGERSGMARGIFATRKWPICGQQSVTTKTSS